MDKQEEQRTLSQNNAIHLYFKQVSDALVENNYSVQDVLKNFTMEVEWTPTAVKEILWKFAQKRMFGKASTTELNKKDEITKVWEVMNRFLGEKLHIESIPFPSLNLDETDTPKT
jgi:hypothetical protein